MRRKEGRWKSSTSRCIVEYRCMHLSRPGELKIYLFLKISFEIHTFVIYTYFKKVLFI